MSEFGLHVIICLGPRLYKVIVGIARFVDVAGSSQERQERDQKGLSLQLVHAHRLLDDLVGRRLLMDIPTPYQPAAHRTGAGSN